MRNLEDILPDDLRWNGIKMPSSIYWAWPFDSIINVINFAESCGLMIWGGDVINKELDHTYDNWYQNGDNSLTWAQNCYIGAKKAKEYIDWHHSKFGDDYYYILSASDDEDLMYRD